MGEASDFGDRRYAEDDHRDRCVTRHRRCRVVSLPSWDIFEHQPQSYREEVLPSRVEARTAVERGSVLGWDKCTGAGGRFVGMRTFGASAALKELQRKFGFEPERMTARPPWS